MTVKLQPGRSSVSVDVDPKTIEVMVAGALRYTEIGAAAPTILAKATLSDGIEEFTDQRAGHRPVGEAGSVRPSPSA